MIIGDIETKQLKDDTRQHSPYLSKLQEICITIIITAGAGETQNYSSVVQKYYWFK